MTGGPSGEHSWLEVRWPEWVRLPLVAHCAVACVLQLVIAYENVTGHALGVAGAFSLVFWLASAGVSSVAAVAVSTRQPWFGPPLLTAEVAILLSASYVLWADYSSAYADGWIRAGAAVMLAVALPVVPPLTFRLATLPGKAWAAGLALLTTLGLTQFTVENFIVPNMSAPQIAVAVDLEETGRSPGVGHVRGVVTLTNQGKATAWIPQAFATVTAANDSGGPVSTVDPAVVAATFDPVTYEALPYSRALPSTAGSGVVWLEDLEPYQSTLPPGLSDTREFTIDVALADVRRLELRVDIVALTNARGEDAGTCETGTDPLSEGFLAEFRRPVVYGGFTSSCLRVPIASRNFVREITADRPSVVLGYAFEAPSPEWLGAFVYYESVDADATDLRAQERASERFDRITPSLVLTTIAALALPLDVPDPTATDPPATDPPATVAPAADIPAAGAPAADAPPCGSAGQ